MCTIVVLRRPGGNWPLFLAANRDEMADRPWLPPGRHWPNRPDVVAGRDMLGGGSWLGINNHGVIAAVMNRTGSLGPDPTKRSRGELVLEALDHADASIAAEALSEVDAGSYRPFNLVVADSHTALWLRSTGAGVVEAAAIPEGVSMLTARDLNDSASPRIAGYLPRFRAALAPAPDADRWDAWEMLLASRFHADDAGPEGAMCVRTDAGFGTLSSSIIALPVPGPPAPIWRFAAGRPDLIAFVPIPLA